MIYIHVPFCKSFCTYCDFYSIRERGKMNIYKESLLHEIRDRKAFLVSCCIGQNPYTLYIGGGTPSQLALEALEEIVSELRSHLPDPKRPFEEFTVEVNPDDIVPEYVRGLRSLGVNRVSMGVQSFDDEALRWMNRRHDSAGAVKAFRTLREGGFDNVSIDLILGYDPKNGASSEEELMARWQRDLEAGLSLDAEHISAYQMGIEEGSALGRMTASGRYSEPSDELCAAQYALLQKMTAEADYEQYEISNFARPGRRALHNSGYWDRVPYIGLGPGAHSFDGTRRLWNPESVEPSKMSNTKAGFGLETGELTEENRSALLEGNMEILTEEDIFTETVMLGLRRADGLRLPDVPQIDMARVDSLLQRGLLVRLDNDTVRIPAEHFFISDSIIRELL